MDNSQEGESRGIWSGSQVYFTVIATWENSQNFFFAHGLRGLSPCSGGEEHYDDCAMEEWVYGGLEERKREGGMGEKWGGQWKSEKGKEEHAVNPK